VPRRFAILLLPLWPCLVATCSKKGDGAGEPPPRAIDGASASAQAGLDASLKDASVAEGSGSASASGKAASFDAGVNACRLVFGPVQQPWTGDAALVLADAGVELIVHRKGIPTVTRLALPSLSRVSTGKVVLDDPPERVSPQPCAVGGDQIFCMDPEGAVIRTPRFGGPAAVVGKGRPGTRVAAATVSGSHALVAYLADRKVSGALVSEAFAAIDDATPVRISEEGSGATAVSLAPRGANVVAMLVDGRAAMTPVHARHLAMKDGQLDVGVDAVAFVGGGAERHTAGVLARNASSTVFALVPVAGEAGFGAAAVHLGDPPVIEEKTTWSIYPNGLDPALIAATTGATPIRVARVRPIDARPSAPRGVELGKLDDSGAFTSYGMISTSGRVASLEVAADALGTLWVYYTDGAGSWLERRVCP
jgi:hypothetical protein